MPDYFPCPYLNSAVELTDERYTHIEKAHSSLVSEHRSRIAEALFAPDRVLFRSVPHETTVFVRWYDDIGKYMTAIVVRDPGGRNWLITAHISRGHPRGEITWEPN
jgi:hypothetical protein